MRAYELEIRAYQESDEEEVVALWEAVFPGDPPWNEPRGVIRRKLAIQRELFLVAIFADRLVGTVLAGFDGCRGWIHHLAVAPDTRRLGVGRSLMLEAEQGLRALGCPKINLQVRATNPGVVRFYEHLGFAVEERVSMGRLLA